MANMVYPGQKPHSVGSEMDLRLLRHACPNCLFVCVEVLRPSQPSGVMSSAVNLPNHTFTGQA